jgi:dihydroorotate dehydrogenase
MASWRLAAYRAARPVLFLADPERIHHLALHSLAFVGANRIGRSHSALVSGVRGPDASPVDLMGLRFRNRVGLGAGFDKDGVGIRGWAALGFGFIELGTVTPRPQPGSRRPRLFRLAADEALINRMGFNNAGADALARRIAEARPHLPPGFVIGVNIGRNRATSEERSTDDYVAAARAVADVADYLAINVSSPNTPGLRDLQDPARLVPLLAAVADAAAGRPLVVKLSSDLEEDVRRTLLTAVGGSAASGVILSNTSTSRDGLRSPRAVETGGLSGRPLLDRTATTVASARGSGLVVIASGGIGSGDDASRLFEAGADLVQIWTGMIYAGPGLIGDVARADLRHRASAWEDGDIADA